jgi:hypothetical protein
MSARSVKTRNSEQHAAAAMTEEAALNTATEYLRRIFPTEQAAAKTARNQIARGNESEEAAENAARLLIVNPLPKPGRGKVSEMATRARDLLICLVVHRVCEDYGLSATHNPAAAEAMCACSIVTKALVNLGIHLSETRLTNIWAANAWRR